jgi:ribonuclease BN (tRNA processing enzyme)
MPLKMHWGHSLYTDALNLAMRASVRQFVLFHHEPSRTKKDILTMADDCKSKTKETKIIVATELEGIDLLGN